MKINVCGCILYTTILYKLQMCARSQPIWQCNGGDRLSYVSATPIIITIIIDSLSQGTASVLAGEVGDEAEAPRPENKSKRNFYLVHVTYTDST